MNLNRILLFAALGALAFIAMSHEGPATSTESVWGNDPMIGEVMWFAGNFAPRGWALCNGQLLSISEHSALFSILGTTYGGDGRTTFALPDMRGRMPMHSGQGSNLSVRKLGQRGGAEHVKLTVGQMPVHTHELNVANDAGTSTDPVRSVLAKGMSRAAPEKDLPVLSDTGSGEAHDNMSPFLTLNACISLQGTFPSRN